MGAVVPTTSDDVIIPSGAIIKLTANTTVNSTTINSGGILLRTAAITLSGTIINNGSIIITSTITANTGSFVWNTTAAWVGGVIPGTYDAVIIPSGSTVALTASDTVNSLTINSGGVLVKNSSLVLSGTITNNGTLTSTTTITANVGTFNWNATSTWVGGVIPGASNDVVIPSGSFISTSTLASITVASTTINSGGSLTIGANITLNGNIFCYGTLTGGSFVITTNGNITVSGTSSGILFSSNSGGFVGTASRIFSLSDGASFDLSKTGATPITSVLSNSSGTWTWIVTNTPNNTTITYKNGSSSTVITALPNSQTYGNLGIKSTSGPSASWTNTLASSLTIAGNLIITNNAPTYRQTLDMLTYTITGNGSTSAVQVVNTNTGSIGLQTQTSTTDFTSIFPGFTPITASTFASYSFNYAGAQAIPGGSYSNLQISGTGAVRTLSGNASVSGTLTLTLGKLFLGNNNLTLGSASTLTVTPSSTTMIVTDGTGSVVKQISGVQSFTFPIGDNTGTAEYSPVTINVKSGSLSSASISARTANSKHSLNTNGAGYINRYWSLASSGITSASMDVTGTYLAADVSGTESSLFTAQYSGGKWNKLNAVNSSLHQITGTNLSSLGDFSASATDLFSTITLAVTFIPEGYYLSDTDPLPVSDNFTVTLASAVGPDYADVETETLTLDATTYTGTAVFTSAPSGNYYIYVKGMALMSTWSAAPLALTQGGNSAYDFTTGVEKAYSIPGFPFLPMILQGTKWCIYSGDIDQDELIGNVDLTMVDNDAFITLEVHGATDLDGDSLVGNVDLTICDNHAFEVVESQSPRKTGSAASKYLHKSLKPQTSR